MSRGRIEKALSGFYYVNTGAETLQCRARGKFRREGMSPLVGDWVQVRDLGGGEGFVEAVEPRRNVFSRPAAANIDQLVILASAAIPVTEPYLIDRIAYDKRYEFAAESTQVRRRIIATYFLQL